MVETLDLFESEWQSVWGNSAQQEAVGAVFTRTEVVELILDLAGYQAGSQRLAALTVLEPSCGDGAFLTSIIDRLLASERQQNQPIEWNDPILSSALRATDINQASVQAARQVVIAKLRAAGCPKERALVLASTWVVRTDFLLHSWRNSFDLVVGNPPYVRIEDLPKAVLEVYRKKYPTTGDRADLYIAFIECGLRLLSKDGCLAFITANRFAKNLYGRRLRRLIAEQYRVRYYFNLEHTQPFQSEVSAYPAIVVIDRSVGRATRAATIGELGSSTLSAVKRMALSPVRPAALVQEFASWYPDGEPWLSTNTEEHQTLSRLHHELPSLEASGPETKVGIGVATGADRIFILADTPDIEHELLLPLLMVSDISNRAVTWSGKLLLNPFQKDGSLVKLESYPRLARYLADHESALRKRHIARSRSQGWYRTIDRVWPALQHERKLVIPDIQRQCETIIGLDEGHFYPHHNVYYITSKSWDLRVLKALLRSSIVRNQVKAYSVQMRGGSVRWQAQTLRKLRLPPVNGLKDTLLERLSALAESSDQADIDEAAREAFSA